MDLNGFRVMSVVLQYVSSIAGRLFTLTIAETGKNAVEAVMAILEEVVGADEWCGITSALD